jgi:hypothetical protein
LTSSNTTSAATNDPRAAGQAPSAPSRPSPTRADEFGLTGPSSDPDPRTNAYRKDLADVAIAGQVIASHYAEPVERRIARSTPLFEEANDRSAPLAKLDRGDLFLMLDDSLGWAWGYGGEGRLVGYVPADALAT